MQPCCNVYNYGKKYYMYAAEKLWWIHTESMMETSFYITLLKRTTWMFICCWCHGKISISVTNDCVWWTSAYGIIVLYVTLHICSLSTISTNIFFSPMMSFSTQMSINICAYFYFLPFHLFTDKMFFP